MILATAKPKDEIGDYKTVTRFAWFPRWVGDKKIWLQKYQLFYEYRERKRTLFLGRFHFTGMFADWDLIDSKVL